MSSVKSILVFGATGKQGGALVNELVAAQPTPPFNIIAITRNTTSTKAKALALKPNVSLVQGDLDDCAAVFKQTGPVWGVFSVQVAIGGGASPVSEEKQGKALIDAAVTNDVQFFVYTSVDRGGPVNSDTDPTDVPHFVSKFRIEKHLLEKAATTNMAWTILRPPTFYDNLTPDFMGKVFAATWSTLGDKKMQLVGCKDIGYFAAQAFKNPDQYNKQSISLAGDELTFAEANEICQKEMGYPLPATFTFVGTAVRYLVAEMGSMFKWFESTGYGADIAELRKQHPGMQRFGQWLKEESGLKQQ